MHDNGRVVTLQAKSYRAAQERLRIAEVLLQNEIEHSEHVRSWAHKAFNEQRRLAERLTFVYGVAIAHGATEEELRSPAAFAPPADKPENATKEAK